jgi:hypothetical protein
LAENGEPSRTHDLVAGTPAVDAVGAGCPPLPTDQRGFTRSVYGDGNGVAACDTSAFERGASAPLTCATGDPDLAARSTASRIDSAEARPETTSL